MEWYKLGLIFLQNWTDFEQARSAIEEYIYWYNTKRIHQGLGYLKPIEKEKILRNQLIKRAA